MEEPDSMESEKKKKWILNTIWLLTRVSAILSFRCNGFKIPHFLWTSDVVWRIKKKSFQFVSYKKVCKLENLLVYVT